MQLSADFPNLFRRELYAVNLALAEQGELSNVIADSILQSKSIEGTWDKEYSIVPIGALEGRKEGEKIKQKTMTQGYTCYGGIAVEVSGKLGLSGILKNRSRDFVSNGAVDETRFSGYLADTVGRAFPLRSAQRKRKLVAKIFNYGGIQAGNTFFNQRDRTDNSDCPDSDLIYDGKALFATPANAHPSYANGAVKGPTAQPVGNYTDYACSVTDTGGYFNVFDYPPSYWALKRVVTHMSVNMAFDDNDEEMELVPDTLLVSAHNRMLWTEILKSKFIEPNAAGDTTNRENIFQMEDFTMKMVVSRDLVANTWYVGKAKSPGIVLLTPDKSEDPWAYWRDEDDRSYWTSYEDWWGFMVRNWRYWCAGAVSTDGSTKPTFGDAAESVWHRMPSGV